MLRAKLLVFRAHLFFIDLVAFFFCISYQLNSAVLNKGKEDQSSLCGNHCYVGSTWQDLYEFHISRPTLFPNLFLWYTSQSEIYFLYAYDFMAT